MPLSWNEIRGRALQFAQDYRGVTRENAETQSFYNDFFNVFGISRRRVRARTSNRLARFAQAASITRIAAIISLVDTFTSAGCSAAARPGRTEPRRTVSST